LKLSGKLILVLIVLFLTSPIQTIGASNSGTVRVLFVKYSGAITPALTDFLKRAINYAKTKHFNYLLFAFDTPGGLIESAVEIGKLLRDDQITTMTMVYPEGASAFSAGVILLLAGHYSSAAPHTIIGGITPIQLSGKDLKKSLKQKTEQFLFNTLKAFWETKKLVTKEDEELLWQLIRNSKTLTATEALKAQLISFISNSPEEVAKHFVGFEVKLVEFTPTATEKFLMWIAKPEIAYQLLSLGALLLILEFFTPSLIAGTLGAMCIIVALYGLNSLPVNYFGVALILLAAFFAVAEMSIPSFGILGILGIISFVIGSAILLPASFSLYKFFIPIAIFFALAIATMVYLIIKSRPRHSEVYEAKGEATVEEVIPKLKVFWDGTLWEAIATSDTSSLKPGDKVKVIGREGLKLKIASLNEENKENLRSKV